MEELDFTRFTPDTLAAIQKAAQFAMNFGSGSMNPYHLVGGIAQNNAPAVMSIFMQKGMDPNEAMGKIAQGMTGAGDFSPANGVSFDAKVETLFRNVSSDFGTFITVEKILNELFNPTKDYLDGLLSESNRSSSNNRGYQHTDNGFEGNSLGRNSNSGIANNNNSAASVNGNRHETVSSSETSNTASNQHPSRKRNYEKDDRSTGSTVKKFCVNMLELADKGKINRAIGREDEVKRVLLILARKSKNNPVLVGEPGTGKTAIAEELAFKLLNYEVPDDLTDLKLYNLDFSTIKSLPDAVGVMQSIVKEAMEDPALVLFIDEIHMLISGHDGADNDIANLMKPAMARGDIKVMGATTLDEYRRIEKDPAFERRFQQVTVNEPDEESAIKILCNAKKKFESHHNVTIPDEVCKSAVKLSIRYITNRRLPDKAIDLIDEAAANIRLEGRPDKKLNINDIKKVVTNWTGIPVDDIADNENERLNNLEEELHASVIGQDKAVKAVANAIKRNRLGFGDASRPIGSFLFLGTTGTGKTELCKAIAQFLFRDSTQMVRIDMSEYQQEHSVHRLFGAPPGYVGFEQGGQLTEAVYRKPFSVVLFDEIEKAHPKIFESLLQVLDDGRMTDGKGKVVNFKNTIIVMTSNMSQQHILQNLCGLNPSDERIDRTTEEVMQQLKLRVAPEFINRIDNIVMFLPLTKDDVRKIAELNLLKEQKKLKEQNLYITFEPDVVDFIVEKGYQPEYGGRPIKRAITDNIINPLTNALVNREISNNEPISISIVGNKIYFNNGTSSRI